MRQALACDLQGQEISERLAAAWASSSTASWFAPVVRSFHVSILNLLEIHGLGGTDWFYPTLKYRALNSWYAIVLLFDNGMVRKLTRNDPFATHRFRMCLDEAKNNLPMVRDSSSLSKVGNPP